jgi:enamine deaminase RidA (YjgF/YER057c/UK114 family)
VERRLISSGSEYEQRWGYSRAVVSGSNVHVAGTAPIMADGADPPPGAYAQMKRCLEIVENALLEAGTSLANVVRTRVFVTDPAHVQDAMRAHGETFGDVRPACTGIVARLFDERWLVEIEVEAVLP